MSELDNLQFHRKYRPKTMMEYIGNQQLKESAVKALNSPKRPQVIMMVGDSGCGKAQPLDSLVLTVNGFKKMGDITIGEEVITNAGGIGKISGIYPQGVRPIYRIQLSDRTYIDVSDEHLNCVWTEIGLFDELLGIGEVLVYTTMGLIEALKTTDLYILRKNIIHMKPYNIYDRNFDSTARIVSVDYIGDQECQCIMVDHPDHTYISDFFIPTHNTTFARLLGKEYSCENRDPEHGACGVCQYCQSIDTYIQTGDTNMLYNIKEVNMAERNGKNDISDIIEDIYIPVFGDEWKVYIFDECHEATSALQNMLLKHIEEPPRNVLLVFCTTNPERMIDTFLNRVQLTLKVKKPTVKELAGLLRKVCEIEQVEYNQKGLEFLANRGELTIRTALQNLQRVVNEQNSAKYEEVIKVFEEVSKTMIIDFFRALKRQDILRYVTLLTEVKKKMELSVFLDELRNFTRRGIYTINGIELPGVADTELDIYRELFADLGVAQIAGLLNKLLTFGGSNLETQLLVWGYTGLTAPDNMKPNEQVIVKPLENELQLEVAETNKLVRQREKETYEQGIVNAGNLMGNATLESILAMGATVVN